MVPLNNRISFNSFNDRIAAIVYTIPFTANFNHRLNITAEWNELRSAS